MGCGGKKKQYLRTKGQYVQTPYILKIFIVHIFQLENGMLSRLKEKNSFFFLLLRRVLVNIGETTVVSIHQFILLSLNCSIWGK